MLNSKYPIIALAMNQVSDIPFASHCADAGITPSISIFCYQSAKIKYSDLVADMMTYKAKHSNFDVVISIHMTNLYDFILRDLLKAAGVRIVEVIMPWEDYDMEKFLAALKEWQGIFEHVMMRVIENNKDAIRPARNGQLLPHFNELMLKGNTGAGAVSDQTADEIFDITHAAYPDKKLVISGGISTKERISHFMSKGAVAIGIGTLFAAAKESPLSEATKLKMIDAEFKDIQKISPSNRNALVFKLIETQDLQNYTGSLKLGIHHPELGGHIYCGAAVDNVKSILTLEEIVQQLV